MKALALLLQRSGTLTAFLGRHVGGVGGSYFEWVQADQSYWDDCAIHPSANAEASERGRATR